MTTGAQYLMAWIACLIRCPLAKLPYLFMYGPENSGKSIIHEAFHLLISKGYVQADKVLTTKSDFNGELDHAVLCAVEEADVTKAKGARDKIKNFVTSLTLAIRKMRFDLYTQANSTHWIQCANRRENCPVFPGDTRITVLYVPELPPNTEIPKDPTLLDFLKAEASHFMYSLMNMMLPEPSCRLRIPIVDTAERREAQATLEQGFAWADDRLALDSMSKAAPQNERHL